MNNPLDREQEILEATLQLPPEQRAAYLRKACGDDAELRERIDQSLLDPLQLGWIRDDAASRIMRREQIKRGHRVVVGMPRPAR